MRYMLLSVKHAEPHIRKAEVPMPLFSILITYNVSVKAKLVIKRLSSSFFNERYGGSKIVSMDKVYKDVNNLGALSISIARSHVTHLTMPRERKVSFLGKTCLYDSHKILPGAVFIVKGYKSKMEIWASVPTEIESVSAIDFVGLTIIHFHSVFA